VHYELFALTSEKNDKLEVNFRVARATTIKGLLLKLAAATHSFYCRCTYSF